MWNPQAVVRVGLNNSVTAIVSNEILFNHKSPYDAPFSFWLLGWALCQ